MGTKILVVNSGSSSIKYRLFAAGDFSLLASGRGEKIGESGSQLQHRWKDHSGEFDEILRSLPIPNHREGLQHIGNVTSESKVLQGEAELLGIGRRVVHGGRSFSRAGLNRRYSPERHSGVDPPRAVAQRGKPPGDRGGAGALPPCAASGGVRYGLSPVPSSVCVPLRLTA